MANSNGNKGDGDDRGLSAEAERYKQAATDALEMVDWCIGYLVGSRKGGIAAQLAQNRAYIRKQLLHEPEEPVPTSKG
jgi:hypothetical protein